MIIPQLKLRAFFDEEINCCLLQVFNANACNLSHSYTDRAINPPLLQHTTHASITNIIIIFLCEQTDSSAWSRRINSCNSRQPHHSSDMKKAFWVKVHQVTLHMNLTSSFACTAVYHLTYVCTIGILIYDTT